MKKLNKVLSAILTCAMISQVIPVIADATMVSSGVIDFSENDDYNITSSYNDYLNVLWGNMFIRDNAAVTYGKNAKGNANTMNFSVNAGALAPVKTDGGVITYKFKYKWENINGTPQTVSIKLGADGCIDLNTSYSAANPDGYIGVAAIDYSNGLWISYDGSGQSVGDKWDTPQETWTEDFCEIQIKVDLYGKRLGFKEAEGDWYWVPMASTSKYPVRNYWQMGLRGTLGTKNGDVFTNESNFYVDDISVSYTTDPAELDTGIVDFENGSMSGRLTPMWGSSIVEVMDDPLGTERGKILKIASATANTGIKYNVLDWAGNGSGTGKLVYEFDVYTNGNNVFFATNNANDNERLGVLSDAYLGLWSNNGGGTLTQYKADVRSSEWQNVKLVLDRKDATVTVSLNGKEQGTTSYLKSGSNDYIFALKATNPISGAKSIDFYIDNIRAKYIEEMPEIGETSHTWLGGIKLPFTGAMDKQSVESGITLVNSLTREIVLSTVDYDETTYTAVIMPQESLDVSASYVLVISDDVKTAGGIYIGDSVERNISLETLTEPQVGDVLIFDKGGIELVSKVKIIKTSFNVPMDKASIEANGSVTLTEADGGSVVEASVVYDMNDGNSVTITTDNELKPNTKYKLTFGTDIKRIDGANLAEPIVKTISTPILERPEIITDNVSYCDMSGVTGRMESIKKRIIKVNVPFNVALDSATVTNQNISLVKLGENDEDISISVSYNDADKAVSILPNKPLNGQSKYKLEFGENLKAINGENMETGKAEFIFDTANVVAPAITTVTASSDGSNFASVDSLADINAFKAEFNYALNPATVSKDTVKLERYTDSGWSEMQAAFAYDGGKCITWALNGDEVFPEGNKFRISFTNAVEDVYGDKFEENYEVAFSTKKSAAVNELSVSMRGKALTYSGILSNGSEAVGNEKMSVLLYTQGSSVVPFGTDTKHFEIITTNDDGSFDGVISLYDNESTPLFSELWLAFDSQGMSKSNQRDARYGVQYTNGLMNDESIADLKRSTKQVFNYITEAADSDEIKTLVPPNGLSAIRNEKLYEGMGVWVGKYKSMTDSEKLVLNNSLENYKSQLSAANISKILNASLIAAGFLGQNTQEAAADIVLYNDTIETIAVEEKKFDEFAVGEQHWVVENAKLNNASGFKNYEVFTRELKKSMLLSMISSTTYTKLADLFIHNKELVNDGLSENMLAALENEMNQNIIDIAMRTIKTANDQSRFQTTEALARAIKTAVVNAQENNSTIDTGNRGGGYSGGSSGKNSFSIESGSTTNNGNNPQNNNSNSNNNNNVFNDLSEYKWAQTAILNLYNKGVISGVGGNMFEPGRGIKREEFLKLVCEAFGFKTQNGAVEFEDVAEGEWYASYIKTAVNMGIVNGISEKHFGIGNLITREDMAVMIFRALSASRNDISSGKKSFSDAGEISPYALEAVETLGSLGIVSGMGDGAFAPKNNATRAEAAVIINRCLQ